MIKGRIDITKSDKLLGTLTWHKQDENGKMLDIGFDFTEEIGDEMKQRVIEVCSSPVRLTQNGVSTGMAYPGSSKHFEALPKHLERLGCRVRSYY